MARPEAQAHQPKVGPMVLRKDQIASKVAGSTLGVAVSQIFVWLAESGGGVEIPVRVEDAIAIVFVFAGGWTARSEASA